MTNESGTHTFILKCDDSCTMTFDGQQRINMTSSVERGEVNNSFTVNLTANTYYPTYIEFDKYTGDSLLQLYWIRPGQINEEIVPKDNLWFDHYHGGQRIELNLTCLVGYSTSYVQDELFCHKTCGDGMRIDDEQWDDSNTNDKDGCSSTCTVEKGYICTGGNAVTSDKWVRCAVGYKPYRYFQNTDYVECIPETDTYNVVFYITIIFLITGMIKYLITNFVRVYKQDKLCESKDENSHNENERTNSVNSLLGQINGTQNQYQEINNELVDNTNGQMRREYTYQREDIIEDK